jgi:hypothetical protein
VITSFFNPAGHRRRLLNYRQFRAALQVPLAAVELSFTNSWELAEHDAEILVRVTDGDVMWQKERLLNVAVAQLPPECEYVAWIDADVLMQDPDWSEKAVDALASVPLVQLFSDARDLDCDGASSPICFPSVAAVALRGESTFVPPVSPSIANIRHGMAWAARRELLERHGLYDGCVIGGGDTAMMRAAYGTLDAVVKRLRMSEPASDHYRRWAAAFHDEVQGRVGALDGEIHHLWHGNLEDRRYKLRHSDLALHSFDPWADVRLGTDGAWRWASDKPALHALLRDYFQNRHDDGRPTEIAL